MPLEKYRHKRSADSTPEPFGRGGEGRGERQHLFVVQKHAARRLHYDFRLEWGGVLRSWAVPQGPSPDPAEKRLAVEVEDHPVEYADFEGAIPGGNYGAGHVIVWDQGRWTPIGDPDEGMREGKLLFELRGYKLRGKWTLVRMKSKKNKGDSGKEWLLIKERDGWVKRGAEAAYPAESIFSGLTLEELASGEGRAAEIRGRLERLWAPRRRLRAADVGLMLAEARDAAFTRSGWIWELKYDGFRLLAGRDGGQAQLRYRHGSDSTATFPEIARALALLPGDVNGFVLDGEVVVQDENTRPRFGLLQKRALLQRRTDIQRAAVELPATYFAFDLLGFEDFDLRGLPLTERKALLARLLPRAGPVRFADHVEERGEELLAAAGGLGLEGVVGKKADSPYREGRSAHWIKVRLDRTTDLAVVGYTRPEGGRTGFGALHVAYWRQGEREGAGGLVYGGRVGTGFTGSQLKDIHKLLAARERATPPCSGPLPSGRGHAWVEPELVCEVRYKEWTGEGLLRHPVFLRLRGDKKLEECVREADSEPEPLKHPEPAPVEVAPARKTVPFSNLKKVFWPEEGYTKGDLLEYYRAISPWLLPHLRDRPIVMTRFPDGITGKSFFQKDAPKFAPEWVRLERMWSDHAEREIDYFVCDDLETLLYVVNLGSIPLHVWSSRVDALERPDYCILDLDPKGAPFAHVVRAATTIHELCEEIGLPSFPKTSGATGLHVLLPLGGQCTYTESRTLGEILARVVEKRLPDITTTARMLGNRRGRVYIDYLQNGHGKTIAGAFSARPVPGATCSAPLKWSEVGSRLDPRAFTIRTLPARMKKLKADPLLPVLTLKPDLAGALARLTARLTDD